MSDLISRSALIEEIRKFQDDLYFTNIYCDRTTLEGISSCLDNAISIIDEHPTAYDVDKVVEELEDYQMWKGFMIYDLTHREREIIRKAIEIVKGGVVR